MVTDKTIKNNERHVRQDGTRLTSPKVPQALAREICYRVTTPKTRESEKTLEARLRREIESRGGMAVKLTSQLHRGLPDRLILMPCGMTYFAEIKSTGKKPTPLQVRTASQLRSLSYPVFVVDSTAALESLLFIIDWERLL